MIITYDSKVDALYVRFLEGVHEVTTLRLSEDVAVDCAPGGAIVGLEILSAHEHLEFVGDQPLMRFENLTVEHLSVG